MFKWSINYYNYQNQQGANFTVKASDKTQAINKAVEQIREQNPEDCELLAICNDGKQYPAKYSQKLKSIFFAIPRSVKIIGYIGA